MSNQPVEVPATPPFEDLPSPDTPVESPPPANPHRLPLQILGVCIASVIVTLIGGISLVPAGVFTFVDAWEAGIFKSKNSSSFLNISPMGWAIAVEGLLIIALPLYLVFRNKLKTKEGRPVWLVLTILFGLLPFFVIGLRVLLIMTRAAGRA